MRKGTQQHDTCVVKPPVLIAGIPRSGTTWTANVLARTANVRLLSEPDNETVHPYAVRAKLPLGRHPVLGQTDSAIEYERLWAAAFERGEVDRSFKTRLAGRILRSTPRTALDRTFTGPKEPPGARLRAVALMAGAPSTLPRKDEESRILVKSVHVGFALDWISERFAPSIVILTRDPLDVAASWFELGLVRPWLVVPEEEARMLVDPVALPRSSDELPLVAWACVNVGLLTLALEQAANRHPEWPRFDHADLCESPERRFKELADHVGLRWTSAAGDYLTQSNQPGTGYETRRVSKDVAGRWRQRVSGEEADLMESTMQQILGARK